MSRSRVSILAPLMAALCAPMMLRMSDADAAAQLPADAPNDAASPAADAPESDTTLSATSAPVDAGTGTTDAASADAGNAEPAADTAEPAADASTGEPTSAAASSDSPAVTDLGTDANGSPITPTTAPAGDTVAIDAGDHAEAKERFAGLMARLYQFESESVDELKEDLKAIATLLHLHTAASGLAGATGDYKAGDLS